MHGVPCFRESRFPARHVVHHLSQVLVRERGRSGRRVGDEASGEGDIREAHVALLPLLEGAAPTPLPPFVVHHVDQASCSAGRAGQGSSPSANLQMRRSPASSASAHQLKAGLGRAPAEQPYDWNSGWEEWASFW